MYLIFLKIQIKCIFIIILIINLLYLVLLIFFQINVNIYSTNIFIDLNKINEKQNLFSSGYVHLGYIYLNTQSYNASSNLIANKNIIINENKNWIVNSSKIIDFKSINKIWKIIM